MNLKRLMTALVVALVISGLFTFWLSKKFAKPVAAAPLKVQVVAASKDLDSGHVLVADDLKLVDWPSGAHLDGSFPKQEAVAGRVLMYPISADQPIVEKQLAAAGAGLGLATKIPEGMRAISLKSDEVVGVAGFMLPGTHVDVLVTYRSSTSPQPITATVLQDVQILAVDQKTAPEPDGKATTANVVTLLVNPEDAEKAVLACAQGSVHFVLRNGDDHGHVSDKPTALSGAIPDAEPHHAVSNKVSLIPLGPKPYAVETINGSTKSTETFQ